MRAPLAVLAVALSVGIGLVWWLKPTGGQIGFFIGAGALLLWQGWRRGAACNLSLLLLTVGLGAGVSWIDAQVSGDSIVWLLTEAPQPITCQGILVSDVEWRKPSHGQARLEGWLAITRLQQEGRWIPCCGRVRLRLPPRPLDLSYGDRFLLHGEIRGQPSFDESRWLWLRGGCGTLTVSQWEGMMPLADEPNLWVRYQRWVARFREELKAVGRSLVGREEAGYLEALLLGEGQGISQELEEAFRKTGTIHTVIPLLVVEKRQWNWFSQRDLLPLPSGGLSA